jgi:hypothetical protein
MRSLRASSPACASGSLGAGRVVVVAGTDPYAYKGSANVMRPHVRPDGQGGCLR